MTNESGPPEDEYASSMRAADQIRAAEDPQDTQHRRACIEEAYAKSCYAPTPEQENALKKLAAGDGEPLELARILRPRADLLEVWPGLLDIDLVRTVRGLVQLSSADAIALVEGGQVPVGQAALVGLHVQRSFVHDYPPGVCEDFQWRAMKRLAEGQPVDARCAGYFKNPIEEVADEILNEQSAERRRLDCERIAAEPYWSVWHVFSWIAFRDVARLCEIVDERSLRGLSWYGVKHYGSILKEATPQKLLLSALKIADLKAVRNGAELAAIYWADRHSVDRNTWFRKRSVRRCWPGPGEWNGFQDEFWSLGQMMLWIITRDPDEVDQASDDAGGVGPRSGYGGFAAAVKLEELLRENREQVEEVAKDLRRRCQRCELKALSGQDVIPATAWIDLTIAFEADGVPIVRRLSQRTRDRAYDNIRFSRVETLDVFKPIEAQEELNRRLQLRTRQANEFNRKQARIAFGKRRWLRLTEIANEYARKRGSLEIDERRREQALWALRCSILTKEFVDKQGRSRVLNMHPSSLAVLRFDPLGASNPEQFDPISEHLWITHQECVEWFDRQGIDVPHRLRRETSYPSMIVFGEAINGAVNLYASGITHQVDPDYDERTGEVPRPITTDFKGIDYADEQLSPEDDQAGDHKASAKVPGRQRLVKRPLGKNRRANTVTAAWDAIGLHDEWRTNGIPPHWTEQETGNYVNAHLRKLIRRGKIAPDNYDYLKPNSEREYEISPDSVDRALVPRRQRST
jgi:hypothetical protein